ncbi:MAG: glycosyltransferase family 4 protein [Verrucomicrobiia bacterium]|jgi:glycosyltransferase involved in cell wall biosynthesis
MSSKPSLLLIEPLCFYPPLAGSSMRYYHLARWLAPYFQITLVAPPCREPIPRVNYLPSYEELGIEVVLADRDRRLRHRVRRKIKYAIKSLRRHVVPANSQVEALSHDDLHQAIKQAIQGRRFDFTVLSTTFLANIVGWLPRAQRGITVLNTQNVESDLWNQWWRETPAGRLREERRGDWQALVRYERRWLSLQDGIVSCSPVDDAWVAVSFPTVPRAMIPNGVDYSLYEPHPDGLEADTALFIGYLSSSPNEQGVHWFCRDILPAIVREVPGFRLLVVGKDPPASVQQLAGPHVEIVGFVEHTKDILRRACIEVVPLIQGGGIRSKILEAFAAGKAVVSTTKGCEGLAVEHERSILIADEPADFAAQVVRLLQDDTLRRRLGEAGRQLVEQSYDWKVMAKRFRDFLIELNERRQRSDSSEARVTRREA